MTGTTIAATRFGLLCGAGALALGLVHPQPLGAQRPVLNAATAHGGLRPVVAQREPDPVAPGPPQAAQNTPPVKDDLFAGTEKFAKGASDVTEVTMDPDSLDLVGGPDAHRAHRMVLNVVRTYSYDKPGMYNPADVEEYRHKLESGDWHCSVHVRDLKSGESTDVCSKRRAPDMVENAIITVSPKSLTFIHNIRKANGQGGGLDTGGFPGLSMMLPGVPMELPFQIMRPVMAAEMMASTAALRAQMAEMMQHLQAFRPEMPSDMKAFRLEMPSDMDMMNNGMKNFRLEIPPGEPRDLKYLEDQMRELQKNAPDREKELQKLQEQLKDLQKNAPL